MNSILLNLLNIKDGIKLDFCTRTSNHPDIISWASIQESPSTTKMPYLGGKLFATTPQHIIKLVLTEKLSISQIEISNLCQRFPCIGFKWLLEKWANWVVGWCRSKHSNSFYFRSGIFPLLDKMRYCIAIKFYKYFFSPHRALHALILTFKSIQNKIIGASNGDAFCMTIIFWSQRGRWQRLIIIKLIFF